MIYFILFGPPQKRVYYDVQNDFKICIKTQTVQSPKQLQRLLGWQMKYIVYIYKFVARLKSECSFIVCVKVEPLFVSTSQSQMSKIVRVQNPWGKVKERSGLRFKNFY